MNTSASCIRYERGTPAIRHGAISAPAAVETVTGGNAAYARAVVFPSATQQLLTPKLGRIAATALIRLSDRTVFMARVRGHAWTRNRLDLLAQALLAAKKKCYECSVIETEVRRALEIPGLRLTHPALEHADEEQWEVAAVVHALQSHEGGWMPGSTGRGLAEALVARIEDELAEFRDHLDLAASMRATADGFLDTAIYNFLVDPRYGQYRSQFAELFPLLLQYAAYARHDSRDARLRKAIDFGLPIVKSLSRLWCVRPGVIRHLAGKSVQLAGTKWLTNPATLARILDCLPPERLPGDDSIEWDTFNRAVLQARALTGGELEHSPATLVWLRYRSSLGWANGPSENSGGRMGVGIVTSVQRFREAWQIAVEHDFELRGTRPAQLFRDVIDRRLTDLVGRGLRRLSEQFGEEVQRARNVLSHEIALLLGHKFWPLLPGEFLSRDCSRVAVPLASASQLKIVADVLHNCLGSVGYEEICGRGDRFIVSFCDPSNSTVQSVAEISVKQTGRAQWEAQVVQHEGPLRSHPSPLCRQALAEVLAWCRTPDARRHFDEGAALTSRRRTPRFAQQQARVLPIVRALRWTLGDEVYDATLAEIGPIHAAGHIKTAGGLVALRA